MRQDHREVVPRSPVMVLEDVDQIHHHHDNERHHDPQRTERKALHRLGLYPILRREYADRHCYREQHDADINSRHNSYLLSLE